MFSLGLVIETQTFSVLFSVSSLRLTLFQEMSILFFFSGFKFCPTLESEWFINLSMGLKKRALGSCAGPVLQWPFIKFSMGLRKRAVSQNFC